MEKDLEKIRRNKERTVGAAESVSRLLGLSDVHRMEAYDISNISGYDSVGSMVVYEEGRPKKNDYRKFRIKSVEGPNDYACMKEALTRRSTHGMEEAGRLKSAGESLHFCSLRRNKWNLLNKN